MGLYKYWKDMPPYGKIAIGVGVTGATLLTIRRIRKAKEKAVQYGSVKGGIDNPDAFKGKGLRITPENTTVWDFQRNGLTKTAIEQVNTLQKELYPLVYTGGDVVLEALHGFKTKMDFILLGKFWNDYIAPKHDGVNLMSKLRARLFDGEYSRVKQYLDSLPDKFVPGVSEGWVPYRLRNGQRIFLNPYKYKVA